MNVIFGHFYEFRVPPNTSNPGRVWFDAARPGLPRLVPPSCYGRYRLLLLRQNMPVLRYLFTASARHKMCGNSALRDMCGSFVRVFAEFVGKIF